MDRDSPEIVIEGLRVIYGTGASEVEALGPLDLAISHGEVVSVVGPSGCGKSTLARTIAGLQPPSSGQVDIAVDASASLVPIATVFQDYAIFPWKSVLDNVRFGLVVNGVDEAESTRRAMTWIDRLGLSGFEDVYPSALSGGMQQRVGIARAFAVEPSILIMDEPFASLDAQLREVLQEELLDLQQEIGCTVLFITHSLEEALVLSDRVVVLSARPGRVLDIREVGFPRPRSSDIRETLAFGELRLALWNILRSQVDLRRARLGPEPGAG